MVGVNAQLAIGTINLKATKGISSWVLHPMEYDIIEKLARVPKGDYVRDPEV